MAQLGETWSRWVRRFWWLRGIAAAITLATLAPEFVDMSRFEILRVFHALIFGWNLLAAKVGQLIGEIPFLPSLSAALVNTIVFGFSIALPGTLSAILNIKKLSAGRILTIICYFAISITSLIYFYEFQVNSAGISYIVLALTILSYIMNAAATLPGYGKGLVITISFVLCIEILYQLQTPWLADQINKLSCEALAIPSENCKQPE